MMVNERKLFFPLHDDISQVKISLILSSPDIAFPRINNIRFWLLPPSLIILLLRNLFYPRPGIGWTVYPLSVYLYHSSPSIDFAIFSLPVSGRVKVRFKEHAFNHPSVVGWELLAWKLQRYKVFLILE